MKKYVTLRELPGMKVGTVIEENGPLFIHKLEGRDYFIGFPRDIIMSNADWFKELKEICKHRAKCVHCGEFVLISNN